MRSGKAGRDTLFDLAYVARKRNNAVVTFDPDSHSVRNWYPVTRVVGSDQEGSRSLSRYKSMCSLQLPSFQLLRLGKFHSDRTPSVHSSEVKETLPLSLIHI